MSKSNGFILIDCLIVMFILLSIVNIVFMTIFSLEKSNSIINNKIIDINLIYE